MFIVTDSLGKQKQFSQGGEVLDDLKYIHEKDAQDALGVAEKQPEQLAQVFELSPAPEVDHVYNIVVAGMGGSALAALMAKSWLDLQEPFEIVRDYNVPAYVDKDTLFIASSYSGNTEETIAALEQAAQKGAQIAVIASGGKLVEIAKEKSYTLARLTAGMQPRYATLMNLKALVTILDAYGVTKNKTVELEAANKELAVFTQSLLPTLPSVNNQAKKIAKEFMGKSVVIYSGPGLFPAVYKWKININENAKQIAWCNELPEFNHNEILGWTEQPVKKPYAVVDIRSSLDNPRVKKRFEVTEKLLSGRRPAPIVVEPRSKTLLGQMLETVVLGDFVSLYLALLNGLNPTPVDLIEKLKKALSE